MFRSLIVLVALVVMGGIADAGPFFRQVRCNGPTCVVYSPPTNPISTMQSPASRAEERHVPQPWSLNSQTGDTSSQPRDTALDPIEGTGSKLPIGPKIPDKITHTVDPEALKKIDLLVAALSQKQQPVAINLPITDETSERSSRLLTILEWLLYAGAGYFGLSKLGGFIPLVVRVVAGLPSALKAASQEPAPAAPATSSTPPKG